MKKYSILMVLAACAMYAAQNDTYHITFELKPRCTNNHDLHNIINYKKENPARFESMLTDLRITKDSAQEVFDNDVLPNFSIKESTVQRKEIYSETQSLTAPISSRFGAISYGPVIADYKNNLYKKMYSAGMYGCCATLGMSIISGFTTSYKVTSGLSCIIAALGGWYCSKNKNKNVYSSTLSYDRKKKILEWNVSKSFVRRELADVCDLDYANDSLYTSFLIEYKKMPVRVRDISPSTCATQ